MTIKDIEEKGMIAYKYMAGSHSQNLNGPDSDIDFHGVYFTDFTKLIGLGNDYEEEVSDEKHDETYHEFGKAKWAQCGMTYTMSGRVSPDARKALETTLKDAGIHVVRT